MNLYRACISYGLPPSEFWQMSPVEPWVYLSVKNPDLFKNTKSSKNKNRISAEEMTATLKKMEAQNEVKQNVR